MKTKTMLCCVAALYATLSSCNSKAKLTESLQGQWTGNPETILNTGAISATMVRILEFTRGASDTEGSITMTALITVDNAMLPNDSITTPLQITASGTAAITGTYQATSDDDLLIRLDATSLSVNVDPEAVQINYNTLTGESAPIINKLKPRAALLATQQINRAAHNAFTNISEIEDIEFNRSTMKCEISHRDIIFSKTHQTAI